MAPIVDWRTLMWSLMAEGCVNQIGARLPIGTTWPVPINDVTAAMSSKASNATSTPTPSVWISVSVIG
jgi:hypothetical protein